MHVCFCGVGFRFQYLAKRLARKNVFKMTYFVSDKTQNLNSISSVLIEPDSVIFV